MASNEFSGIQLLVAFLASASLTGCASTHDKAVASAGQAVPTDVVVATQRVDRAIDAANHCVGDYVRQYDAPTITPGDVLDAALAECRPFFEAHRGALHTLTLANEDQPANRQAAARAHDEAERHAGNFKRIVRETGLAVLVQRRSAASSLLPHVDEGEISL